ncbi:MAG TPA: zinc-binding dehydrogenase [Lacipirellula sp.]
MKAVVLEKRGKDGIRVGEFPDPKRPPGNALVRIHASALNHVDLYMRDSGKGITHELPLVLGVDGAGEVVECDADSGLKPGQRVVAFPSEYCGQCEYCLDGEQPFCTTVKVIGEHRHGGMAQYMSMKAHSFLPLPDSVSYRDAAAMGVAYITAWRQVFAKGRTVPGETVVIQGIGGGVALATLQLAKVAGARIIVTSSSDEKLEKAKALGADEGINYKRESISKRVLELTDGRGADVAYDNVGEATWSESLKSVRRGGKVVVIGATTGGFPPADLQRIFIRQLTILGSTTGSMWEFRDLYRLAGQGKLKPVIDSVWPMDKVPEALARLERGEQFGKIVIDIP